MCIQRLFIYLLNLLIICIFRNLDRSSVTDMYFTSAAGQALFNNHLTNLNSLIISLCSSKCFSTILVLLAFTYRFQILLQRENIFRYLTEFEPQCFGIQTIFRTLGMHYENWCQVLKKMYTKLNRLRKS